MDPECLPRFMTGYQNRDMSFYADAALCPA
jgi:hypothetical protein